MFLPIKSDNGALLPWEYMSAAAGDYKAGQLLTVDEGFLAAIEDATTEAPPYLCMADITLEEGGILPVTRISEDYIYETTLAAADATAAVGGKLQIAAGGLEAAAGPGAFEIVYLDGKAAGDMVRGRFAN